MGDEQQDYLEILYFLKENGGKPYTAILDDAQKRDVDVIKSIISKYGFNDNLLNIEDDDVEKIISIIRGCTITKKQKEDIYFENYDTRLFIEVISCISRRESIVPELIPESKATVVKDLINPILNEKINKGVDVAFNDNDIEKLKNNINQKLKGDFFKNVSDIIVKKIINYIIDKAKYETISRNDWIKSTDYRVTYCIRDDEFKDILNDIEILEIEKRIIERNKENIRNRVKVGNLLDSDDYLLNLIKSGKTAGEKAQNKYLEMLITLYKEKLEKEGWVYAATTKSKDGKTKTYDNPPKTLFPYISQASVEYENAKFKNEFTTGFWVDIRSKNKADTEIGIYIGTRKIKNEKYVFDVHLDIVPYDDHKISFENYKEYIGFMKYINNGVTGYLWDYRDGGWISVDENAEETDAILDVEENMTLVNAIKISIDKLTEVYEVAVGLKKINDIGETCKYNKEDFDSDAYEKLKKRNGIISETSDEIKVLEKSKEVILYGPPGTGKTKKAQELADSLILKNKISEIEYKKLVQFHPGYSYNDFVETLTTSSDEPYKNMVFKEFADTAKNDPGNKYVLIIDEINRANVSEVFGELLYGLEYRNQCITTGISGDLFKIPDNLYIIGTMNTADRSLQGLDYAIRRRFSFIPVVNEEPICDDNGNFEDKSKTKHFYRDLYKKVNEDIMQSVARDVKAEDIIPGISYYIVNTKDEVGRIIPDQEQMEFKLKYELIPLLQEYSKNGMFTAKHMIKNGDEKRPLGELLKGPLDKVEYLNVLFRILRKQS